MPAQLASVAYIDRAIALGGDRMLNPPLVTGRMLVAGTGERWMYALVHAAVVVRVVGPLIAPGHYLVTLVSASALWSAGFALYLVVYGPRLVRARIDGRDG